MGGKSKKEKRKRADVKEEQLVEKEEEDIFVSKKKNHKKERKRKDGDSNVSLELEQKDATESFKDMSADVHARDTVKKDKKDKTKKEKKKEKKKDKKRKKEKSDNDDSDDKSDTSGDQQESKRQANDTEGSQNGNSVDHQSQMQALDAQHSAESKALTGSSENGRIVASSAIEFYDEQVKQQRSHAKRAQEVNAITLLLFYQYVEPVWDENTYNFMLHKLQEVGEDLSLTGRMRVAREGLNCTLTGSHESIVEYCNTLRRLRPKEFASTEFKLTNDLPLAQKFPNLKVFKVVELVHYGLEGSKAPPIAKFQGTHLEPKDYHVKLAQPDTVVIDVRNHYEAAIGRFTPPNSKWLDPKMRKSTEFPAWLDKPETKELMKGKQVLMYCTGGIRCERASALLKYKMETDPEIKDLGIKGVYQLQGGIDKYFKEFPDGGYWKGKNYVFDKRFAHAPPKVDGELHGKAEAAKNPTAPAEMMGKCEACQKPWDMYRGKRRCPTCGVPSLICKECFLADKEGRKKLGKEVRCDLCVEQGIKSKRELREKDQREIDEYEAKMKRRGLLQPETGQSKAPNPDKITRLRLKNMCRKNMDEATLIDTLPGITHIVWRTDRKSGNFLGQGWVEMATPDDAARALLRDGKIKLFGRPLYIAFDPPDGKDAWPPHSSTISDLS